MGKKVREKTLLNLLVQTCKLLRDCLHARMAGIGLHRGQGLILFHLGEAEGITQAELAQKTMVRSATLTRALQGLEKAGLIERRPDSQDHRLSRVFLTGNGHKVRLQAKAIWQELERELRAALTPSEGEVFRTLLLRIQELLRSDAITEPEPASEEKEKA